MWIPQTEKDIRSAVDSGLVESETFDAKADLGKNVHIAEDVAAMSTDGGVLLYGIAEDENKKPRISNPIKLVGVRERVDNVVHSGISEPPAFWIHEIEAPDSPGKGYVVVHVPLSPRAPHQVTIDGQMRFYGRTGTANRRLTQQEIERLYRRREDWARTIDTAVDELVRRGGLDIWGSLFVLVRPVVQPTRMAPVFPVDPVLEIPTLLREIEEGPGSVLRLQPGVMRRLFVERFGSGWKARATEWASRRGEPANAEGFSELTVGHDGRVALTVGRVGRESGPDYTGIERRILSEQHISAWATGALAIARSVLNRASYWGPVDVGLFIAGTSGCVAESIMEGWAGLGSSGGGLIPRMDDASYRQSTRLDATMLDEPTIVARSLLASLWPALSQGRYSPFK